MVEKSDTPELIVGLAEVPENRLITSAMFTPSKIGGLPANISPLPPAAEVCGVCKTKLTFLAQIYANVDILTDFHRSIYVFACLSERCINTSGSVRAFREIIHDLNKYTRICTDDEFDEIYDLSDNQLETTGKWAKIMEKIPEPRLIVTKETCVMEEFLLDTVVEPKEVTKFYLEQSKRIKNKTQDDEAADELEQRFTDLHFGKNNREFELQA